MFDIKLMDKFYQWEDTDNENEEEKNEDDDQELKTFDAAKSVKDAYCIFIKEICPLVSSFWHCYLKNIDQNSQLTFHNMLTKSDEAFAFWLVKCQFNNCKDVANQVEQSKETTEINDWSKLLKKGKIGKHDSTVKFHIYCEVFAKITKLRENQEAYEYWQQVFFQGLFNELEELDSKPASSTKTRASIDEVPVSADFS